MIKKEKSSDLIFDFGKNMNDLTQQCFTQESSFYLTKMALSHDSKVWVEKRLIFECSN